MPRAPRDHERYRWPQPSGVRVVRALRVPDVVTDLETRIDSAPEEFLAPSFADGGPERERDWNLGSVADAVERELLQHRYDPRFRVPRRDALDASALAHFAVRWGRVGSNFVGVAEWGRGEPKIFFGEPVADLLFELSALRLARDVEAALRAVRGGDLGALRRHLIREGDVWWLRGSVLPGAVPPPGRWFQANAPVLDDAQSPAAIQPKAPPGNFYLTPDGLRSHTSVIAGTETKAAERLLLAVVASYMEAGSHYAGQIDPRGVTRVFGSPLATAWRRLALSIGGHRPARICPSCSQPFMPKLDARGPEPRTCRRPACQKRVWRESQKRGFTRRRAARERKAATAKWKTRGSESKAPGKARRRKR